MSTNKPTFGPAVLETILQDSQTINILIYLSADRLSKKCTKEMKEGKLKADGNPVS